MINVHEKNTQKFEIMCIISLQIKKSKYAFWNLNKTRYKSFKKIDLGALHRSALLFRSSQNEQELVTKSFYNFHIKNTNKFGLSDIIFSNQVN